MRSGIECHRDLATLGRVWTISLTFRDAIMWDRERLDMLEDAIWLAEQAMFGERTEGPRSLPRTGLPSRAAKKLERSRQRGALIVLAEPKVPDAPLGQCRWCGELLTGENASRRRYCYPDREGRDCIGESGRLRVWSARDAVIRRGDEVCAICGSDHWDWDADHIVALEDGGEHSLGNLRRLCSSCHDEKTARENAERARSRASAAPRG